MSFIKNFIALLFVLLGIFPTLIGIMIAGEQYRIYLSTWGVCVGFSISLLGILMILFGFWLSLRKTRAEIYELKNL